MTDARKACLLAVVFAAAWTAVETVAHFVLHRYSAFQVVWSRYAVHLLFMLVLWGWREPASLWRTRRPLYQFGRSLLMLIMPGTWAIAMARGGSTNAFMAIFWLSPLLIVGLGAWLLGERPARAAWAWALVASAGAWLTYRPHGLPGSSQLVLALLMALSFSLYVVMTRPLRDESTRVNLFYTALGVFVALTPLMPRVWQPVPMHDLAIFAIIGLVGYVALWCIDRFTALAPVSLTAPLLSLQVAFTTLTSLGHTGRAALLGATAIGAAALATWRLSWSHTLERPA